MPDNSQSKLDKNLPNHGQKAKRSGPRTDPVKTAMALALGDIGYGEREIAQKTGIPRGTVWGLLHAGGKYVSGPVLRKCRQLAKDYLQARTMDLADRCLLQVEKTLHKASAYQAAGIYGLLRTHERLDAGEATQHVAVISKTEITGLDALADALRHSLTDTSSSQAGAKDPSNSPELEADA